MRGKKAKEIRKFIQALYAKLEPLMYERHKHRRYRPILREDATGVKVTDRIETEPFYFIKMADCQRLRYQKLKTLYKTHKRIPAHG